jgi:alpha-L-fucosidase
MKRTRTRGRFAAVFLSAVLLQVLACHAGKARTPVYRADWQSLATHQIPVWLVDDKFGIFIHWMPNSVPAYNDEWYARWMYKKGNDVYEHHRETWGDQKTFGYKDFIPRFTAENWDPDEWVAFFKENGARFVVPNAEHHDHFAMWDSDLTAWDSMEKGPKRDVVGELASAARRAGLRFGVSNHRARGWNFYTYEPEFDTTDPAYADFYWPQYGDEPDEEWLADWRARLDELVDKYQPDLMWFDYGWGAPVFEPYKKDFAAYYFNRAADWGKSVTLIYKGDNLPKGVGVLDVERGKLDRLWPELWMTDTTVFENTWGYVEGAPMKTVDTLLHDLIDIVSKNGALLLNVGPRPDGTIPEDQKLVLRGMGSWLEANGEAIYETRPFTVYMDGESVRYTRKGNAVYAIFLERPSGRARLGEMAFDRLGGLEVNSVSLLDGSHSLEWAETDQGLEILFPAELPGSLAWTVKVELTGVGFDRPTVRVEHLPEGGAVFAYGKIHNFTDNLQTIDSRLFINGNAAGSVCRVRLEPGTSGDVRFEHRDQNHYGATHLLLTEVSESVNSFSVGRTQAESPARVIAYPSIPMLGTWLFHAGDDPRWSDPAFDDSGWDSTSVPGEWPLERTASQVGWFRRTVFVPTGWEGRDLYMNLGVIDDADETWFNGCKVGEKGYEKVEFHFAYEIRKFRIPSDIVEFGENNVLAVRVYNHENLGGLRGPPGFITVAE